MFAFYDCNSALEMKRYMQRFIHHIDGLPDLRALRFTKYNQYESMILPMVKYLENHGAQFHFNTQVMDVRFDIHDGKTRSSISTPRSWTSALTYTTGKRSQSVWSFSWTAVKSFWI